MVLNYLPPLGDHRVILLTSAFPLRGQLHQGGRVGAQLSCASKLALLYYLIFPKTVRFPHYPSFSPTSPFSSFFASCPFSVFAHLLFRVCSVLVWLVQFQLFFLTFVHLVAETVWNSALHCFCVWFYVICAVRSRWTRPINFQFWGKCSEVGNIFL